MINPESGLISVSEGANLDPDLTSPSVTQYLLEVVAIDGGVGSEKLTGWTRVIVNITDVNNKPPRFAKIDPILVSEDATVGLQVRQLIFTRTVKRGQRIKPGRTFFQLILPLYQPLKINYLVSFSVLS